MNILVNYGHEYSDLLVELSPGPRVKSSGSTGGSSLPLCPLSVRCTRVSKRGLLFHGDGARRVKVAKRTKDNVG